MKIGSSESSADLRVRSLDHGEKEMGENKDSRRLESSPLNIFEITL
jgi:hypothetical protein